MSGDLRDQLLKAGVVSKKQARKAAHEKRTRAKKIGRDAVETERATDKERVEAEREANRAQDRERERQREAARTARQTPLKAAQIVESGRLEGRIHGPRRFYFESRDGRVPFLEVSDETAGRLEVGRAALVESSEGALTIIQPDAAHKIVALDPKWLRVWHPRGASDSP